MSSTAKQAGAHKYIALGLLLLLTVLIRLPVLSEPWGADQAGFGYVAKGMLEGKVPYRDMYSLTAYGVFFAYVLFFKLFGMTMASIHIGHMVLSLTTVILVFILAYRLYGIKVAVIASLCYTIFSNGLAFSGFGYENKSAWGTYWYLSQREVFMAPLITGAIILMTGGEKRNGMLRHLVSGILIGLAAFFKLTAVVMLLLFALIIAGEDIVNKKRLNFRKIIGQIFCLISGFVIIQLPFVYYFWIHDALKDVYQALFVHLSAYAKLSRGLRIETLFSGHFSILSENLILWLFAAISCLHIYFKDRNRNNIIILLWCLGSLVMVWGQGKFFGYHFIVLVPPFAVLTGYGLMRFFGSSSGIRGFMADNFGDMRRIFILATVAVSIMGFCISNYEYYRWHVRYYLGKISKEEYYRVFDEFPTHPYSFPADYQIVQYLNEYAEDGDKLEVVFSAGDTVIHFITGRESVTRFIQSWYLFPSNELLSKDKTTIGLRNEFVHQIIDTSPRFILVVHIPLEELVKLPYLEDDPDVRILNEFIRTKYKLKSFPSNRFLFTRVDAA